MKFTIVKAPGFKRCSYIDCNHNPNCITDRGPDAIVQSHRFLLKEGTLCAQLEVGDYFSDYSIYYCRECIDRLYGDINKVLNTKLWPFQ